MANWWRQLITPQPVESGPAAGLVGDPAVAVVLGYGLLANALAGPESTRLEKGLFVATPFIITAAAVAGAQKGNEEFSN